MGVDALLSINSCEVLRYGPSSFCFSSFSLRNFLQNSIILSMLALNSFLLPPFLTQSYLISLSSSSFTRAYSTLSFTAMRPRLEFDLSRTVWLRILSWSMKVGGEMASSFGAFSYRFSSSSSWLSCSRQLFRDCPKAALLLPTDPLLTRDSTSGRWYFCTPSSCRLKRWTSFISFSRLLAERESYSSMRVSELVPQCCRQFLWPTLGWCVRATPLNSILARPYRLSQPLFTQNLRLWFSSWLGVQKCSPQSWQMLLSLPLSRMSYFDYYMTDASGKSWTEVVRESILYIVHARITAFGLVSTSKASQNLQISITYMRLRAIKQKEWSVNGYLGNIDQNINYFQPQMSLIIEDAENTFKHIHRILNTNIDGKRTIPFALDKIKGVGRRFGFLICKILRLNPKLRAGELSEAQCDAIANLIADPEGHGVPRWFLNRQRDYKEGKNLQVASNILETKLREDVERLFKIRSNRGLRHKWGLKVRGQHTKTTGRRGKTVGVERKKK